MRNSLDGLSGLVRNQMDKNPLDGDLYIFLNKRRGLIKLLLWDRSGYVIYAKRLERGTYKLPNEKTKTNSDSKYVEYTPLHRLVQQFARSGLQIPPAASDF